MVFVAAQRTLAGVILVFGASALTWNVVNTAGNVLCLAQSPEASGRAGAWARGAAGRQGALW